MTILRTPKARLLSRIPSMYSWVYGPSRYSSPSISVSSVRLGMMTLAFSHNLLMPFGKSGPNTEYSFPLSAIAGST